MNNIISKLAKVGVLKKKRLDHTVSDNTVSDNVFHAVRQQFPPTTSGETQEPPLSMF